MMVDMLDSHWYAKLGREHVAARLNNEKLESELYPVGSWRDHPPTGIRIDLSQPHPELTQPTDDDDEDRPQPGRSPRHTKTQGHCACCSACPTATAARQGRTTG